MNIADFLKTVRDDARAAEQRILKFVSKAQPIVDGAAKVAETVAAVADPSIVPMIQAGDAAFDELVAAIEAGAKLNDDGSITHTVSPATVAMAQQAISDGKAWLASAGVKL